MDYLVNSIQHSDQSILMLGQRFRTIILDFT